MAKKKWNIIQRLSIWLIILTLQKRYTTFIKPINKILWRNVLIAELS